MFLVAGGIGVAALGVGLLLGPKRPNPAKLDAYESGIPASGTARERFPIHFYLVAMIFIISTRSCLLLPAGSQVPGSAAAPVRQRADLRGDPLSAVYVLRKGVLRWK